jgi:hypothetical protein
MYKIVDKGPVSTIYSMMSMLGVREKGSVMNESSYGHHQCSGYADNPVEGAQARGKNF